MRTDKIVLHRKGWNIDDMARTWGATTEAEDFS